MTKSEDTNGNRIFLRVFSLGDLITLGGILVASASAFATLVTLQKAHEESDARIFSEIRSELAAVPTTSRDVAVLQRAMTRAESDRIELKNDMIHRLDKIEEQNREILRRVNGGS